MMKGSLDAADDFASLPLKEQALIKERAAELRKEYEEYHLRELAAKAEGKVDNTDGRAAKGAALSSLSSYVRRRGGKLKLVAEIPNVGAVELELTAKGRIKQSA